MGITDIFDIGLKIIDKVIPDPAAKAAAQLELLKVQQQGSLSELNAQLSGIIAEAQSSDPYTSRARPSFLYVMYTLILMAIPMAIISVISPATSTGLISGFHQWLAAIPDSFLQLFGIGYLGYTGSRALEKYSTAKFK